MGTNWFLVAVAILLANAETPKGHYVEPKRENSFFYAKVEMVGFIELQIPAIASRRFPKISMPRTEYSDQPVNFWLDISKLKGMTNDKLEDFCNDAVRITGTLKEVRLRPFMGPKHGNDYEYHHMVVVDTLEQLKTAKVIHFP